MEKQITLRYAARCKKCGLTIPSGSRAVWLGKGKGTQHLTCSPEPKPEAPKQDSGNIDRFTLDYSELRGFFADFIEDPMKVYTQPVNASAGKNLRADWKGSEGGRKQDLWAGCSIPEMSDFIANGFRVSGLDGVTSLIPAKPRRKIKYGEEGDELLVDLAWAGDDKPFADWEKRVSKPGLSVEIHMTFHSGYSAKTISQYQRWVARALQTLDENGVDMEVNIIIAASSIWSGAPNTETLIRVRKAGEASDFANWSAMFSPGGFRMLGIMSIGIHADRRGKQVGYGYGFPRAYGDAYTVAYDDENNRVVIGNSNRQTEFPEFEMTEKLKAVLQALSGD